MPIKTPIEALDYSRFTKHTEMLEFCHTLAAAGKTCSLSIIGTSAQGRSIPALFFSADPEFGSQRARKPAVLIFCQQHGNEPAGREAALNLAKDLSLEDDNILDNLDLILIPSLNPDGAELQKRVNSRGCDLNRDHILLEQPETQALHQLFHKCLPEVTLDVHEYDALLKKWKSYGCIKDADIMLDGVTNLNADVEIIDYSRECILRRVGERLKYQNYRFHRYIVGSPGENSRFRHSTTEINDGRNSFGLFSTLSFVLEGKRYRDLMQNLPGRIKALNSAMYAFLKVIAQDKNHICNLVKNSRERLLHPPDETRQWTHLKQVYVKDCADKTLKFPVFDLKNWSPVEKAFPNYYSRVAIKKSLLKPHAYLFLPHHQALIKLLLRHNIKAEYLKREVMLELEFYQLEQISLEREGKFILRNRDFNPVSGSFHFPAETAVVKMNQMAHNLIPLLLEPGSHSNIVFPFLSVIGFPADKIYPVFRMMKDLPLPTLQEH